MEPRNQAEQKNKKDQKNDDAKPTNQKHYKHVF